MKSRGERVAQHAYAVKTTMNNKRQRKNSESVLNVEGQTFKKVNIEGHNYFIKMEKTRS